MCVSYSDRQEASAWFGRYRVVRSIGEGGSAQIYLGQHVRSGKQVAIKVPRPRVKNAASTLQNEARLLGKLRHTHIIDMHMYGVQQNQPFLVLDYAPYGNLRHQFNAHRPWSFAIVVHFVGQLASALHYIHSKGLIHCDIKPENMLLLKPDHLVLSDFGIAVPEPTPRKKPAGTIRYMAPEQLLGTPCQASDQYALAVLVFEWLNGKPPFTGTSLQIMQQHISAVPPRLQRPVGALSSDIDSVLRKALAKDPAARFSSVEEFFVALKENNRGFRFALSHPQRFKSGRRNFYTTKVELLAVNDKKSFSPQKKSSQFLKNLLCGQMFAS